MIRQHILRTLLVAGLASYTAVAQAEKKSTAGNAHRFKKPKPTRFLRVQRNKKKVPVSLETAVVRYVPATGKGTLTVDLVGAVHVGDKSYYQELNKRFTKYDVVLYELVAPKGTRIKQGERNNSAFARIVKNLLKLESQVQQVDYTKKNFVHADLSFAEMAQAMEKRGESTFSLVAGVFADMMRQAKKREKEARENGKPLPEISLATLLFDPNRHVKLKRYMAEEFDRDDTSAAMGQTLNRLLIKDRNKACMKVLDEQIKKGKQRIAIFYGAAHLPDFETRLLKDYGLKRKSVDWVTAWDIEK